MTDVVQQQFVLEPAPQLIPGEGLTIGARFEDFHSKNPWVYRTLVRLTRDQVERGRTRVGIKMLIEVIRWQHSLSTFGDVEWRLNNNYTSRFARLIMEQEPDLAGIFETRALQTP